MLKNCVNNTDTQLAMYVFNQSLATCSVAEIAASKNTKLKFQQIYLLTEMISVVIYMAKHLATGGDNAVFVIIKYIIIVSELYISTSACNIVTSQTSELLQLQNH